MKRQYRFLTDIDSAKIQIVIKSILVGFLAGLLTVGYRLALTMAEKFAFFGYDFIRGKWLYTLIGFGFLALAAFVVGTLVKWNPMISGSGIPQLEGIMKGYFKNRKSWFHTIWCKFLGGTIGILSGLSLGREGPSIQLGASVGEGIAQKVGTSTMEKKILMVSGASAGLSAAFNAPMAGVIFALEEIYKYFSPLILLSSISAAVVADFVSKQFFGFEPVFHYKITQSLPLNSYWLLILLGIIIGCMGSFYNFFLLYVKKIYQKMAHWDIRLRMLIPFFTAGIMGLFFPKVLGGGHAIIEELELHAEIRVLLVLFAVKLIFSMISFCSGAPGGIFFPLLVLGATLGGIIGLAGIELGVIEESLFYNFIILAMAGFFSAIVRAPITGIVLIMEMTGSFTHMLSLTIVSVVAYIVADLLKCPPIYDSLLEGMLRDGKEVTHLENQPKTLVEIIVRHESLFENRCVKDIDWPAHALLVGVKRGEIQLVPKGDTKLHVGDYLVILVEEKDEALAKHLFEEMNTAHFI